MERLELLMQRIDKFNKDRDWNQFHSPCNLSKSISIEAGELLECFQWNSDKFNMDDVKEETPIWNVPSDAEALPNQSINNSIPLWENIQPKFDEVSNNMSNNNQELSSIDITSNNESSVSDSSPFWIPVSDEKLETSSFPNINIPITDNLSSNDNFGFPDLNNN